MHEINCKENSEITANLYNPTISQKIDEYLENSLGKTLALIYFKIKKLRRINYYKKLKQNDSLSAEYIGDIQWKKLKKLINHCYNHIPYYNKLFNKNNIKPDDIKTLKDLAKIPKLTKQDIISSCDEILDPVFSKDELFWESTSGSTGEPLKFARSFDDQEHAFALRYRANAWCGWEPWNKSVWFVSDTRHIKALNKIKGRFSLWLMRRLLIDTKDITKQNMFKWVKQIKSFKPTQVYGYSSLLGEFAEFLIENSIKIEGIKGVFSTAEPLNKRMIISKAFNAPVYDQYGCSEIPCIAHECKCGNMHLNSDEIIAEFEDIPDGSGLKKIICTPLYAYSMPLLRYEMGDTAFQTETTCECGLPYPVIKLKIGRISDNFITKTGKIISGVTLAWYIVDAVKGVQQYQIIQKSLNEITVKLISDHRYVEYNEQSIKALLCELMNSSEICINFEHLNKIELEKNGKFRPVISMINNK